MGLARASRCDVGRRRLPADLVSLIEGMGLRRPRSSVAAIHRRVAAVAEAKGGLASV
jgi:putative transposase